MHAYGKARQFFLAAGSLLGWVAVILQFYLILKNREASVPETIIRYFSFFTVLTNLLATLCFSFLLLSPHSAFGNFFSRTTTLSAIAVYMCIVGIIYNLILRFLWNPQGLQRIADELLHVVNPVWFLLFWIIQVSKSALRWKHAFIWLIYPVLYVAFILFRGAFSGFYPYPFSNVHQLGYPHVLLNCTKTILAFFVVSLLFVWIGKRMGRRAPKT
jgi:hypothetical protein